MSNKQQTAVDWLLSQFDGEKTPRQWEEVFKQAKGMHREEIEQAFIDGKMDSKGTPSDTYYKDKYEQ